MRKLKLDILDRNYHLRPMGCRLMGIDFGLKRLGIGVSNHEQDTASPLKTLHRRRFSLDIQELALLLTEYDVKGIIFGWPINMDGSESKMCDRVRAFADELGKTREIGARIKWMSAYDERLSTKSVDEFMIKNV